MRLAARGLTSKEIARELGLSVKTVEGYLDGAKAALDERYRRQAVAKYLLYFEATIPGESIRVVGLPAIPAVEPPTPEPELPVGRGLERLSRLRRLGIIVLISLALTASLALAATTAVRWIAIYDANGPPRQKG